MIVISESSEHWVPQLTQFMLKSRIGKLSFPCETAQ